MKSAIIGMSLGNSYFKPETIRAVLRKSAEIFDSVYVMIPDLPSIHTYHALGYSSKRAMQKQRKYGTALKNHCRRAILTEKLSNVELVDWETHIEPNQIYQDELRKLVTLYNENHAFQQGVRDATRAVIEGRRSELELEPAITEGVPYLLKELAYLSASPYMHSIEQSTYVYHKPWPIFEKYVAGEFTKEKRSDLGFLILN